MGHEHYARRDASLRKRGGYTCVKTLQSALIEEPNRRGYDGQEANPWYFPTVEDYGGRLNAAGFEVRWIALNPAHPFAS
jgi:hypothetical protein